MVTFAEQMVEKLQAILLANAVSPHIDNMIQPRVFGTGKGAG